MSSDKGFTPCYTACDTLERVEQQNHRILGMWKGKRLLWETYKKKGNGPINAQTPAFRCPELRILSRKPEITYYLKDFLLHWRKCVYIYTQLYMSVCLFVFFFSFEATIMIFHFQLFRKKWSLWFRTEGLPAFWAWQLLGLTWKQQQPELRLSRGWPSPFLTSPCLSDFQAEGCKTVFCLFFSWVQISEIFRLWNN